MTYLNIMEQASQSSIVADFFQILRMDVSQQNETISWPKDLTQAEKQEEKPMFFVAKAGDKMSDEIKAFEAQKEELLKTYLHQFVAIHHGQVLDYDSDKLALLKRLNQNYPNDIILIRQVKKSEENPVIKVRSPYLTEAK